MLRGSTLRGPERSPTALSESKTGPRADFSTACGASQDTFRWQRASPRGGKRCTLATLRARGSLGAPPRPIGPNGHFGNTNCSSCRLQNRARSIPPHFPPASFPWGRRQWAQPSRIRRPREGRGVGGNPPTRRSTTCSRRESTPGSRKRRVVHGAEVHKVFF